MEQYVQVIILAGLFVGSIIAGIITALMRTSTLSANQKTNQTNIASIQDRLHKTSLAAAKMYGKLEAYTEQIKHLQGEIKKIDGQKDDLARLLMAERAARQEDKKKYESQIAALNDRVKSLESDLAIERRKSQSFGTPVGAPA